MRLLEAVRSECISTGVELESKSEAIAMISELACRSPSLDGVDPEAVRRAIEARENLGSTGFGRGVAIPHCRIPEAKEFVVGLVTVKGGIDFDSIDGAPVRLVVFIVAPQEDSDRHIRILSGISQALLIPGAVDEIVKSGNPEAASESFFRYIRDETDTRDHHDKRLFHVFVQDEDKFKAILQVFSGINTVREVVLEASQAREYLVKVPLFAGILNDSHIGFCRLLVAVVEKRMTNEVIRRIEGSVGSLDEAADVMVMVQDIFYSAGSLST